VAIIAVSGVPWLLFGRRLKAETTATVWDLNEPNNLSALFESLSESTKK
jgi:hypothetical protein